VAAATALRGLDLGERAWLRLAEARQKTHPAEALPVYWRLIEARWKQPTGGRTPLRCGSSNGRTTRQLLAATLKRSRYVCLRCVTGTGVGRR